jgi:hypothetical protein
VVAVHLSLHLSLPLALTMVMVMAPQAPHSELGSLRLLPEVLRLEPDLLSLRQALPLPLAA